MPTNNFISNLLEIKDLIVTNISSDSENIHISFICNGKTMFVLTMELLLTRYTIIVLPLLKIFLSWDGKPFFIIKKDVIIAIPVVNILTNPSLYFQSIAGLPIALDSLPLVLSIDEFRGNAGEQKFQAILTDPKQHKVFDILPSRTQYRLKDHLNSFKNKKDVQYFIMDMNYVYREIAESYFPNATIVIDKFHVVRYVTWALENVRKRVQKTCCHINEADVFYFLTITN